MAQTPCNSSRRCQKCTSSIEKCVPERSHTRRPTVHGVADLKQMTVQRSRARLINQLTHPENELFVSGNLAASHRNPRSYPTYAITSHTSNICRRAKEKRVVPTYPVQSLRWNPYVETSSIEDFRNDYYDDSPVECSCDNCTMRKYLAKESSNAVRPGFRDNIMTFCDQYTMTPRLADAGCGCTDAAPRTRESQISVNGTEFVDRDPIANMHTASCYTRKYPAPILKKPKAAQIAREFHDNKDFNYENYYADDCEETEKYDKAEKDTRGENMDRVRALKSRLFQFCEKKTAEIERKIIYNEGISDTIANHYPLPTMANPSSSNVRRNRSRMGVNGGRARRVFVDEEYSAMPYSHRSDSRYHQYCKEPSVDSLSRFYYDTDDRYKAAPLVTSPPKTSARCKTPPSRLPKRVLTSDRHIDVFVDSSYSRLVTPPYLKREVCIHSALRS